MKKLVPFIISSFFFTAVPALASEASAVTPEDHHGSDYSYAANIAYQLADLGEDYQSDYDYRVSDAARSLHMAASDLYYALNGGGNENVGMAPMDHHGGGSFDALVDRVGDAVRYFSRVAPYHVGQRAQALYRNLANALRTDR